MTKDFYDENIGEQVPFVLLERIHYIEQENKVSIGRFLNYIKYYYFYNNNESLLEKDLRKLVELGFIAFQEE